jgi:cytidylate kinase
VIAISREAGALGETVAREVGRRLECPVYDREITERIAEELHQPVSALRQVDERPMAWIEDWMSGLSKQPTVSTDTFLRHLVIALRGMAQLGRCVMVGRGASWILPAEHTLRVRLIGDRADRIRVVQAKHSLSEEEAARWVDRTDQERSDFAKRSFGADLTDPHAYDLVLNTSRLSVHECSEAIIPAFLRMEGRPEKGTSPA